MIGSRKAKSHVLCKRIDGALIGVVDHIEGDLNDVVCFGNLIITLIFTKRLGQYVMDCSAAIDRAQRWKDTNVADVHDIQLLQCNDNWK